MLSRRLGPVEVDKKFMLWAAPEYNGLLVAYSTLCNQSATVVLCCVQYKCVTDATHPIRDLKEPFFWFDVE